ncbi:MAG: mannose-1-phosphate guanylyltransferase/mannose-6-phosphate isomerase [Gammaproteobacteria bacterium]|nr:mannose-1-phosphate guanylyltransferase/mannose-6-phosphate isomerase [Gammaproteobacteria bacterium]
MFLPVVIAGGIGSRLWPVSRALLPKQFIHFPQYQGSLFQNTLRRVEGIEDISEPLVVCNADHRFLVAEQLRELGRSDGSILLEPIGRDTAPAVAMAAFLALQKSKEAILLVLPSDHLIKNNENFHAAVNEAVKLARRNFLITFGIVPGTPETGYGYINRGEIIEGSNGYQISKFVEKPDKQTAESYLSTGDYFWNSGMFVLSAKTYLDELKAHAEDIYRACEKAIDAIEEGDNFDIIPEREFSEVRSDSIDYAVMEKTSKAAMVPMDAGWNDLGAWDALWEEDEKDAKGNSIIGDVLTEGVANCYIQAHSRLVAAVGVEDAIIVETPDAVLVSSKEKVQSVKQIVHQIEANDREEYSNHTKVFRPWGSYESIINRDGYQVKHIIVNPGEALSLQLHNHRAEHWTVIKGKGVVTCDGNEITLGVNESTFIPLGSKHRLANPFEEVVEIVEVQVGDYLGEDDIVRFEDKYGRIDKS